ncbi:hypothetical protein SLH49_07995 [Cognatiyoonia sp. IB215446]|uniref:lipopolysaccharide biosynthesis protein n=1 Tax=Cognatiyoonia sp. IB215446 TaxID=3097355 RepID=UPI002A15782D|nr:hypothetical protein [Cognatiyoonia sp. IB215446]MDX8347924.1 hypothetical protein [Cognatiyoonia sp. IB215446]
MVVKTLSRIAAASAWRTLTLRGGIVAMNFGVMIGLAALMGLAAFGELAVIWGLAMIASTALSCGAPLVLLRYLNDGHGMSKRSMLRHVILRPAALAIVGFGLLHLTLPTVNWAAVLLGGLAVHLATCLASIMRALGSVQASMALRDAAPPVGLGLAGLSALGAPAENILLLAAVIVLLFCGGAFIWCLRQSAWRSLLGDSGGPDRIAWSLWGTALLGMGLAQVDIVLVGAMLPAEQVGLYAVLRRLANLVALPVSVATWVSAKPISAAFGTADREALSRASAKGSQIAFLPGLLLFGALLAALPVFDLLIGQSLDGLARWTLVFLAIGALIQVAFASGMTVATLCGGANQAAISRGISIFTYLTVIGIWGAGQGIAFHALAYAAAMTGGTLFLWARLRRSLGIDTSAAILWPRLGGSWRMS